MLAFLQITLDLNVHLKKQAQGLGNHGHIRGECCKCRIGDVIGDKMDEEEKEQLRDLRAQPDPLPLPPASHCPESWL